MIKFEVGRTYTARFISDSTAFTTIQVVKRTAKTITALEDGKQRTFRIKIDERKNCEYVKDGSYSMAPSYRADEGV